MTPQIGHNEHQVTVFLVFTSAWVGGIACPRPSSALLRYLGRFDVIRCGQSKPTRARAFAIDRRAGRRRKAPSATPSTSPLGLAGTFCRFDSFSQSARLLVCGYHGIRRPKTWAVPRDHLSEDIAHHRLKAETPRFAAHGSVIERVLEQQIAQTLPQARASRAVQ